MKALTLYIDKWYIIGAICTDGVPRLIKPKSREDCFWLYFYEDVANDQVVYGKDNKPHFHNNENHYYGDVFSLLPDSNASFWRYGHKEEIAKIFKASGIIDELKAEFGADAGKIETYISFSKDISDEAKLVFRQNVLEPENFEIKQFVARIGHLSLEHASRQNFFNEEGYYLLLNACNENLFYSLYEYKDSLFLIKDENFLNGYGADLRGRALLEYVVKNINQSTHFLQTQKEFENEYLRLTQYVDDWILRLENAKPGRPVTIPNVTFSRVGKGNVYKAIVQKKDIDSRTSVIVSDIIREIASFVRKNEITNDRIKGVLFLGNTFTNEQFLKAIKEQFTLPNEKYVHFKTKDLPNIVAVYTVMDCSQFDFDSERSEQQGEAQLKRQQIAKEEKERQERAEKNLRDQQEKDRAAHEADKRYEEAMRNVDDYEKKREYAQMEEWARIALNHRPDDPEAKKKQDDAVRLLSEQKVKEDQYRAIITRAQQSLKDGRWPTALAESESALNLRPDSAEAKRIYDEAQKHIATTKAVEKYINRADLFMAQKLYDEALQELEKVLSLEPENSYAKSKVAEIEGIRKEHSNKVNALIDEYDKAKKIQDFEKAILACEKLAEVDTTNQRKWAAEIEKQRASQEKAAEEQKRYEDLKQKADDVWFNEDYQAFIHYATEALQIKESVDLQRKVEKAKQKLAKEARRLQQEEEEKAFQQDIETVKSLISERNADRALDILKRLEREYPDHQTEIKGLRKQAFNLDFQSESSPKPQKRIGFSTGDEVQTKPVKQKSKPDKDSFFEDDPPPKKMPTKKTNEPKREKPAPPKQAPKSNPKTGIDFFDMDFGPGKK